MKNLLMTFIASLFLLTACNSVEYNRGYEKGVSEARTEIEKGTQTIYSYGDHYVGAKEFLKDPQTGYLIVFIAGCIVNDFDEGRAAGHNETIRKHFRNMAKKRD